MKDNTIIITNDNDYEKECKNFIEKLLIDVNIFSNNQKILKTNIFTSNNHYIIYNNENQNINSPIGILDGSWGTGKTYFIDKLCKYVNDNINKVGITNIIYLNAIDYVLEQNISEAILLYIFDILKKWKWKWKYDKNNNKIKKILFKFIINSKNWRKSKKIYNYFINDILLNFVNNQFSINIPKIKKSNKDIINKIDKITYGKKILLIVDNIERLHSKSWEIIYMLSIFSQLNNFIIFLPINLKNLDINNKTNDSTENAIKKYVNLPIYKIEVSYFDILKKYFNILSDDVVRILEKIILMDYKNCSLRELKQVLFRKEQQLMSKLVPNSIFKNFKIMSIVFNWDFLNINKYLFEIINLYKININILITEITSIIHAIIYLIDNSRDQYTSMHESNIISKDIQKLENFIKSISLLKNFYLNENSINELIKFIENIIKNDNPSHKDYYKKFFTFYSNEITNCLEELKLYKQKYINFLKNNIDYKILIDTMIKYDIVNFDDDLKNVINELKTNICI